MIRILPSYSAPQPLKPVGTVRRFPICCKAGIGKNQVSCFKLIYQAGGARPDVIGVDCDRMPIIPYHGPCHFYIYSSALFQMPQSISTTLCDSLTHLFNLFFPLQHNAQIHLSEPTTYTCLALPPPLSRKSNRPRNSGNHRDSKPSLPNPPILYLPLPL